MFQKEIYLRKGKRTYKVSAFSFSPRLFIQFTCNCHLIENKRGSFSHKAQSQRVAAVTPAVAIAHSAALDLALLSHNGSDSTRGEKYLSLIVWPTKCLVRQHIPPFDWK